jgi:hypothetical protein
VVVNDTREKEAMHTFGVEAVEQSCFEALGDSTGFRFSSQLQHSWCTRRAVNEGLLTLSILRDEVRLSLLAAWMKSGDTLLDFIEGQLPDPSAELAVCRFEQLSLRAHRAAASFKAPDPTLFDLRVVLQRGRDAGLAFFHDEPALLVAPGLNSLCRRVSPLERRLWARLAVPSRMASLIDEGLPREAIEGMLQVGALELAC